MKKIMTMILMLAVVLGLVVLTGCNQDVSTDDPQTNVKDYENLDEMNQQLDVNLNVPAGAEKAQFNIVDGKIAQSDYYVDDIHYVVRVTKGQQDNLSGISVNEKFTNDETAEICGLTTKLRYNVAENNVEPDTSYGVADAYDSATDISYCVFMIKGGTKDLLVSAMEKLITGDTKVTTQDE